MIQKIIINKRASESKKKHNWITHLKIPLAAALLLAFLGIVSVSAASSLINIEWGVFSGGGGRIGAGDIQLDSSLGEPITGESSGGDISLDSGTWTEELEALNVFLPVILR